MRHHRSIAPARIGQAARPVGLSAAVAALTLAMVAALPARHAAAQALALSVNGDPVTSFDIEQRMKLLRAMHKPASREAAVESMIETRLKDREAVRFSVTIRDEELGEEAQILAKRMKTTPQQLMQDYAKAGVTPAHVKGYLRGQLGYYVLIRALNRGVEASEIAVRQELAKEKGKTTVTSYTIRQVVFTLNPGEGAEGINASVKQAEALRTRFTSCATGIPYAKSLPGVAVRDKLTRSSSQLNDGIKEVLDKTPVGHLTNPSRSPNGIELIAVCDRSAATNDDDLRKEVSERILNAHMEEMTESKYREMRAHAIIGRH